MKQAIDYNPIEKGWLLVTDQSNHENPSAIHIANISMVEARENGRVRIHFIGGQTFETTASFEGILTSINRAQNLWISVS